MSDWISVEERLPEGAERVIAYDPARLDGFNVSEYTFYTDYAGLGSLWRGQVNQFHGGGHTITHWMPLPSAPDWGGRTREVFSYLT